jgi:hypothetical protein
MAVDMLLQTSYFDVCNTDVGKLGAAREFIAKDDTDSINPQEVPSFACALTRIALAVASPALPS